MNESTTECRLEFKGEDERGMKAICPECGSSDTEWHCDQYTDSGVVDGRLRMHEVKTRFFLGCNSCSETIRVIGGDDLARLMTETANG